MGCVWLVQQKGYKVLFSFLLHPKYKSRCRIHEPSCFLWLSLQTSSPVDDTHGKEPTSTLCSSLWGAEGWRGGSVWQHMGDWRGRPTRTHAGFRGWKGTTFGGKRRSEQAVATEALPYPGCSLTKLKKQCCNLRHWKKRMAVGWKCS